MRKFLKILLITLSSIVGIILIIGMLVLIFENDIKRYMLEKMNARLNTRIEVESIDLTIWDRFPAISLRFNNIAIKDAWPEGPGTDTLLFAENLYLEMNIWDVLGGDYSVHALSAESGFFVAAINAEGNGNYFVFKDDSTESDDDFSMKLNNISLKDMRVDYKNVVNDEQYSFFVHTATADGDFSQNRFVLTAGVECTIGQIQSGDIKLLKGISGNFETELDVNTDDGSVYIKRAEMLLGNVPFTVTGSVAGDSTTTCDLQITAAQAGIQQFYSLLPTKVAQELNAFSSSGTFEMKGSITGPITATTMPLIQSEFSVKNAVISAEDVQLTDAGFEGSYTNKNLKGAEELVVKQFSANMVDGYISGYFTCREFSNVRVSGALNADFSMKTLAAFADDLPIVFKGGKARIDSEFDVKISELQTNPYEALSKARFKMTLDEVSGYLTEPDIPFTDLAANIILKEQHALIHEFTANIDGNPVTMDGALQDLVPALILKDRPVNLVASISTQLLDLDYWTEKFSSASGNTDIANNEENSLVINKNFNANLDCEIGKLTGGKFAAEQIRMKAIWLDNTLEVQGLTLNTAEGRIKANALLLGGTNNHSFELDAKLENVDIPILFEQFNNFAQTYITNTHLSGKLNSNIRLQGQLDSDYNPILSSMNAIAGIKIQNGRIKNLPALTDLTDYLKSMKAADLFFGKHIDDLEKRLQDVKFETLENEILVNNSTVLIPTMEIKSTALNLFLTGKHTFTNEIDYQFNFLFRDLKIAEEEDSEFGKITDDRKGIKIFVKMTGTSENPIFTLDKEELKKSREEKRAEEKELLKSLLKEDFGMFKKDSTLRKTNTIDDKEAGFILYDEEIEAEEKDNTMKEETPKNKRVKEPDNKKRVNKVYNKWLQQEKEKQDSLNIEIDP
jgi:hypothetical protein